jgi:predicted Zn finger-like uncharacterized protein
MILTCPSCDTRYQLDMAALRPEGQTVRCFKCRHTWTQKPPKAEDEGAAENIGRIINWLLFLIIFGGAIGGAVVYRDTVRDVWPVSNRLYTLIGLDVEAPGTGFELRSLQSKRGKKDGVSILTINGEIANISRKVRAVPVFSGELTDSAGEPLHSWTFTIRQKNLRPEESVPFKTTMENAPKDAANLNIIFLDPESMMEEDAGEMDEEAMEEKTPSEDTSSEE